MALATWWTTDSLPERAAIPGLWVNTTIAAGVLAELNGISVEEVARRRAAGHRAYVGFVDDIPVTYGWVATREAEIGELGLRFRLPSGDRYLWDFATLPAWQGRGLYPQLLRVILTTESETASRFWIIHAPENLPSGAGIQKAGFRPVGRLSFATDGRVALTVTGPMERAQRGAELLGVPLASAPLRPCWRCQIANHKASGCACCAASSIAATCACATQPRPTRPYAVRSEHVLVRA
jgi:GNAT superfamily N-acetyltransferase